MVPAAQPSVSKSPRTTDGDATDADVEEKTPSFSPSTILSSQSQALRHPPPPNTLLLERAVVARTRFHITLPTRPTSSVAASASANLADQRGWSCPHGEPYRPLGRPELNLKFSPKIIYGASPITQQNAQRVRALEAGGGSSSGTGGAAVTRNSTESEKVTEPREPSSCITTSNKGESLAPLVDQFVTSLTSRSRFLDERQVKLAHRLQANSVGFIDVNLPFRNNCELASKPTITNAAIHPFSSYVKPSMKAQPGCVQHATGQTSYKDCPRLILTDSTNYTSSTCTFVQE
ncbi:hypothetical protein PHPALM_29793 [Phytophthora palmivora]|uniref:Uncharacterized protein n=1 Tax=Phytophthora palmivora TaxID=4796 RepID=A0A2P4X6Q4_9STRA|nr:hypothetical protein PHPALM_29793 [Phytophthora palmivora]